MLPRAPSCARCRLPAGLQVLRCALRVRPPLQVVKTPGQQAFIQAAASPDACEGLCTVEAAFGSLAAEVEVYFVKLQVMAVQIPLWTDCGLTTHLLPPISGPPPFPSGAAPHLTRIPRILGIRPSSAPAKAAVGGLYALIPSMLLPTPHPLTACKLVSGLGLVSSCASPTRSSCFLLQDVTACIKPWYHSGNLQVVEMGSLVEENDAQRTCGGPVEVRRLACGASPAEFEQVAVVGIARLTDGELFDVTGKPGTSFSSAGPAVALEKSVSSAQVVNRVVPR